jgi:hypothetical protein
VPDVRAAGPFAIDLHLVRVPDWLVRIWDGWGRGTLQRPLLVGLLVAGLLADGRRLVRVAALLPPLPELGWTAWPARWGQAVAAHAHAALAGRALLARRVGSALAGLTASIGTATTVVLHELAVLVAAAAAGQPTPEHATSASPGRRWVRTIGYLRLRRELGQRLGRTVERSRRPPQAGRPAEAAVPVVVFVGLALGVALTLFGDALAGPGGTDGVLGFLANLFDDLADWWNGLPVWQQVLVVGGLAALLTLGGVGLAPALSVASGATWLLAHGRGAASFIRNPSQATRSFLTTLTPGQLVGYAAEVAVGRLVPAAFGGVTGRGLRRELDDLLPLLDDPAQLRRYLAQRRALLAELRYDETGAIRLIREDNDFFAPRNSKGIPKAHIQPGTGDLLPAAPNGNATLVEHMTDPGAKGRSPYISFSQTDQGVLGRFGRRHIELDLEALERDIHAGHLPGTQVLRHEHLQAQLRAAASAIANVDYARALGGKITAMERYVAGFRHSLPRESFLRLNRLMHAIHFNQQTTEYLVKGVIPARYYTGPQP